MAAKPELVNLTVDEWLSCCGSTQFAAEIAKLGPFDGLDQAIEASRTIWWSKVDILGWLEAFVAHPRIGDVDTLRRKFASEVCAEEQSEALGSASDQILKDLAEWNRQYEKKFGFIFLICATGKSSAEILAVLKSRFTNRPIIEFQVAAAEQQKITELRLLKKIEGLAQRHSEVPNLDHVTSSRAPSGASADDAAPADGSRLSCETIVNKNPRSLWKGKGPVHRRLTQIEAHITGSGIDNSQQAAVASPEQGPTVTRTRPPITTHVLDVSRGRPGSGIDVTLDWWKEKPATVLHSSKDLDKGEWTILGTSVTDDDGRSGPLMPLSNAIPAGRYRLTFHTEQYFLRVAGARPDGSKPFYPFVSIVFQVTPSQAAEHFHVPVLLSPYAYSTYRGS